ncbi:MAG: FGGY family carbohydrate kinase [Bacteroidota bacterium]
MTEVLLIFDVGKTNKKVLLFDRGLALVHEAESRFDELTDEDGFPAEDARRLENWILKSLKAYLSSGEYLVKGINFTSYGATLAYLDERGNRLTPLYNYMKPMPEKVVEGFYASHGGLVEFCRKTASPALGMLNAGLQLLWLKRTRPEVFSTVKHVLHLPQYLSYLLTRRITSEHTSIGCHTAMWDFDAMRYHPWMEEEGISLPDPQDVSETVHVEFGESGLEAGIGIHDSSSSLVPYILAAREPFVLVSTGTWCISMNPFNQEALTAEELKRDCLCFLSVNRTPVKSSRFFLGRIHDLNVDRLASHFGVKPDAFMEIKAEAQDIKRLWETGMESSCFFPEGIPDDLVDQTANLSQFHSFPDAYSRLMADLTRLVIGSLKLVISKEDRTKHIYITGGFAKNPFFTGLMALAFPDRTVFTSRVDNATSLGAALVISEKVWKGAGLKPDLGLKQVHC